MPTFLFCVLLLLPFCLIGMWFRYMKLKIRIIQHANMSLDRFSDWLHANPHVAVRDSLVAQALLKEAIRAERKFRDLAFFSERDDAEEFLAYLYRFIYADGEDDPLPPKGAHRGSLFV